MSILKSSEQIRGTYDNQKCDFDRYNFITQSPIATKEISVVVDFENGELTGDKIAHGSWFDIELVECIELLETLKPCEIKRDFKEILKSNQNEGERKNMKNPHMKKCHKCKTEQELDFNKNVFQDISGYYLICLACNEWTSIEFDTDYFY